MTMITLDLQQQMNQARLNSDQLFAILQPEALYQRPIAERHRLIFYLGHLEAFDRNLLAAEIPSRFPELDRLFAFGIDPVDGELPSDQPQDWPDREKVEQYVAHTRAEVDSLLNQSSQQKLQVALEHRWMHCETLAYLFHRLPYSHKQCLPQEQHDGPQLQPQWRKIPAGGVQLGKKRSEGFGWCNEFEALQVDVPEFEIQSLPVSNGHFLEFIQAGGYQQRQFWSDADWQWKESVGLSHPGFWIANDQGWDYQGMFARIPLPLSWPVYVSQAEACAYARWRGWQLPEEAQFQRAAYGPGPLNLSSANLDFRHWEPQPVGSDPASDSAFGVSELVGNGWEWTCTPFGPLPGFEAFDFYKGYSANFFDGKHFVIKGASARTAMCLTRPSFRNWFQPHYPNIYAKFRCVRS
ncbi:SUMF1/EgtB/PvdO family nonheme iron enzyme [bacterium]|nr:SUMF1/EgtB/PvdO family nonheme iron enzyme [bacterium]